MPSRPTTSERATGTVRDGILFRGMVGSPSRSISFPHGTREDPGIVSRGLHRVPRNLLDTVSFAGQRVGVVCCFSCIMRSTPPGCSVCIAERLRNNTLLSWISPNVRRQGEGETASEVIARSCEAEEWIEVVVMSGLLTFLRCPPCDLLFLLGCEHAT